MSDRQNQQEVWGAAGRAAALLVSFVVFTAIWESDSQRGESEQIAEHVEAPTGDVSPSAEKPVAIGSVELDRTLQRNSGLVRVRLLLGPASQKEQPGVDRELVFRGDVSQLRSQLVSLLDELDSAAQIIPASAQADLLEEMVPLPTEVVVSVSVPQPRNFPADSKSEEVLTVAVEPATARGFIFLGRKPAMPESEKGSLPEDEAKPDRQPRLLNWRALPRCSTSFR